jgi:signal transduction histidine kinase
MSERAMTMGADGYLQKGLALRRILEYVREIADTPTAITPIDAGHRSPRHKRGVKSEPPDTPAWDALSLAPYGVLEVADDPLFPILHANPTAQRLFQTQARVGVALGTIAPELTSLVAYNRLDDEASFPVTLDGTAVHATLRRTGKSLLIYLDSSTEDVGKLRRAIATTAHEIRVPVSVLCGIAETLTEDAASLDDAQRAQLMSSVARQARTLDALSADLLTTAQIQRGTLSLDRRALDPVSVIDAVVAGLDLVTVSVEVDDDRPVKADPLKLEQMLANLLGNAIKYGRPAFVVRVRPSADRPDLVAIDVVDAGDGVAAEFTGQLFREFARAPGSVGTGTGLGLYVVRTLALAHGGDATYAPAPGGGAVFTVTLPAA